MDGGGVVESQEVRLDLRQGVAVVLVSPLQPCESMATMLNSVTTSAMRSLGISFNTTHKGRMTMEM